MRIYDFNEDEVFVRKGKIFLETERYRVIYVITNQNLIFVANIRPIVMVQTPKTEIIPIKSLDSVKGKPHIEKRKGTVKIYVNGIEKKLLFEKLREAKIFKKLIKKVYANKKIAGGIIDEKAKTLILLYDEVHLVDGKATITKIFGKNVGVDTPPKRTLRQKLASQSLSLFFKKIFKRKK